MNYILLYHISIPLFILFSIILAIFPYCHDINIKIMYKLFKICFLYIGLIIVLDFYNFKFKYTIFLLYYIIYHICMNFKIHIISLYMFLIGFIISYVIYDIYNRFIYLNICIIYILILLSYIYIKPNFKYIHSTNHLYELEYLYLAINPLILSICSYLIYIFKF